MCTKSSESRASSYAVSVAVTACASARSRSPSAWAAKAHVIDIQDAWDRSSLCGASCSPQGNENASPRVTATKPATAGAVVWVRTEVVPMAAVASGSSSHRPADISASIRFSPA